MAWVTADLGASASVAAGSALKVSPRTPVWFGLYGTFSATLKFQWSPDATGSVWYDIGAALTAGGMAFLPAGLARRVRVNTTVYASGTPVAIARYDTATDAYHIEREYVQETLEAKASVAAGTAKTVPEGCQVSVMVSGTFSATLRVQVSMTDAGSDWYNWGSPITAAGAVTVPRGLARRVRLNTTAYTSGTPAAVVGYGKAAEGAPSGWVETVTSGALNLFADLNSLTVAGTQAYTIADGFYVGQELVYYVTSVSGVPVGTITPANFVDGTSIEVTRAGQGGVLMWTTGGWKAKQLFGAQTYETALRLKARVATTANGTLATAFANGQTVDGVVLATGDLVLLKNQTAGAENGLYVVQAAGAPVRSVDFDEASEVVGGVEIAVQEGTVNADTAWLLTNDGAVVVGTTALTFSKVEDAPVQDVEFAGAIGVTAIDFSGVPTNTETLVIGTETWTKVATETNPFEFDGGTANACAVSLNAAINADTTQAITSFIVGDTVYVVSDVVGTAGNLAVTNNLTNTTGGNMVNGANAGEKQVSWVRHTVTASEVASGEVHIPLPFAPTYWDWKLYTSAGVEKVDATNAESYDGAITAEVSPNRLKFAVGTNLLMAATDVLHVIAYN